MEIKNKQNAIWHEASQIINMYINECPNVSGVDVLWSQKLAYAIIGNCLSKIIPYERNDTSSCGGPRVLVSFVL